MKDRIVEHPNRYKLKPVDGENGVYDLEPMPGVVTEVGTPLNKGTLLSEETAILYQTLYKVSGSNGSVTVDDALSVAALYLGDTPKNIIFVTLTYTNAQTGTIMLLPGITVTLKENGVSTGSYTTDQAGVATVKVTNATATIQVEVPAIFPVTDSARSFAITLDPNTNIHLKTVHIGSTFSFPRKYSSSVSYACVAEDFKIVPFDVFVCGGGGGGGMGVWSQGYGGGGGGGGRTNTRKGVKFASGFAIGVGSGGAGNAAQSNGYSGGNTYVGTVTTSGGDGGVGGRDCVGGSGGSGGGQGYYAVESGAGGTNGGDGFGVWSGKGQGHTTREFEEATGALYSGGGGGYKSSGSGAGNAGGQGGNGGAGTTYGGNGQAGIAIIRYAK